MNKARRLLYSIPIALVALVALLVAIPAGAAVTGTVALTKAWLSADAGAVAGSATETITVTDADAVVGGNTAGAGNDAISVLVVSTTDGTGVNVTLNEDAAVADKFVGVFNVQSGATVLTETFNGDGATTVFPAVASPPIAAGAGTVVVTVGGAARTEVAAGPGATEYTVNRATGVVTFGAAPPVGVGNVSITYRRAGLIQVNNADTVTVRYTDPNGQFTPNLLVTKTATVDNIDPVISSFSPATGTVFGGTSVNVSLSVTATDDRSGFTPDANDGGANEALVNANFSVGGGAPLAPTAAAVDAAGALTTSFASTFGAQGAAYTWKATVIDRAGNQAVLDAATTAGQDDATFSVDNVAPVFTAAVTGLAMNATNTATTASRKSVQATFGENLDSATVDASDFSVAGATVTAAILGPNVSGGTDFRNRVFLTLAADLAPDAKPQVSLVGTVRDRAGNSAAVVSVNATDGILPALGVSVVGDVDSRPAAKSTLTVTVTSDEDLISSPNVTFGSVVLSSTTNTTADRVDITDKVGPVAAAAVSGQTRTWSAQVTQAAFAGLGLVNVRVAAQDKNGNNATKGVTGNGVDLSKATLGEFDNQLAGGAAPVFTLNPIVTVATDTDSTIPFIQISYAGEGTENPVACPAGGAAPACAAAATDGSIGAGEYAANTGDTAITVDSHTGVTITSAKFGLKGQTGADVVANVQSTGKNTFIFQPASALAVGSSYTLSIIAKDEIGNTVTVSADFTFNVVAPKKVTINVVPGWNLISFPDNPDKMGINDVFGANAGIVQVLTYDTNDPTGPWLVSQRGTDGKFGTAQIVNVDTLHAYWVQATKFETVSVTIPRRQAGLTGNGLQPAQVNIKKGWNLVGVIDTTVPAAGTAVNEDVYFGTLGATWQFAYTFNTATGAWERTLPADAGAHLAVGKGYWLYTNADGLLVP